MHEQKRQWSNWQPAMCAEAHWHSNNTCIHEQAQSIDQDIWEFFSSQLEESLIHATTKHAKTISLLALFQSFFFLLPFLLYVSCLIWFIVNFVYLFHYNFWIDVFDTFLWKAYEVLTILNVHMTYINANNMPWWNYCKERKKNKKCSNNSIHNSHTCRTAFSFFFSLFIELYRVAKHVRKRFEIGHIVRLLLWHIGIQLLRLGGNFPDAGSMHSTIIKTSNKRLSYP